MNHTAIEIKYSLSEEILTRYQIFKKQNPTMRARQIASELNISEGEMLACQVGENIVRLNDDMKSILEDVASLNEVMALTRNEYCVHERKGIYKNGTFSTHGKMSHGLFVNPDIDLRLFMNHWKFCFASTEDISNKMRHSLQFFDKSGIAIHKIYLTDKSDKKAFETLITKHKKDQQDNFIDIETYEEKAADRPDTEINWEGFRKAWEDLKDTHDFYPMLRKFRVSRRQALRNIGKDFAYEVGNDASRNILQFARDEKCEIMVFVGNRGMIQIHTGEINKLLEHGSWYNVLDPKFNLHLNEDKISNSWVTKKPTVDGIVTSLEVFDENDELIVTFFGKRKPGIPELELWRQIVEKIAKK